MAIWDFSDYDTKDLKKALELIEELNELGFDLIDDDAVRNIKAEIEGEVNE